MEDEDNISPIPIGGSPPPPREQVRKVPPPPVTLEPLPAGAGGGSEVVRLKPVSSAPPAPASAPVPLPGSPGRTAWQKTHPTPAPARTHGFAAAAGLALLLTALFVPHWTWARSVAEGYPSSPVAAWLSLHAGSTPFAGDLWEGMRAALLVAGGGIAAAALFFLSQKYNSIPRAVLHVASTTLTLVVLGIVVRSLGSDTTRWDFSDILTSAGLVYPVVALFWSRPRWVQLLFAALALGGSWLLFSQPPPEGLTAAQVSLQPLLPTLGLMLLGVAAGETVLHPYMTTNPTKTTARGLAVTASGVALAAAGWALYHYALVLEPIPDAPLGALLLGAGGTLAAAGIFGMLPRRAVPFTVIGSCAVAFYVSLHTLAPFLHRVLSTHFGPDYLASIGAPATPVAQNIAVALILWLAAAWLSYRKTSAP